MSYIILYVSTHLFVNELHHALRNDDVQYECCGVDGYEDFDDAEKWQRNRTLDLYGYEASYVMEAPIACCATNGSFPKLTILNQNCSIAPTEEISNYQKVCFFDVIM